MRPTFSIIFFTVASGAGYGLWMLMALASLSFWPDQPVVAQEPGAPWPALLAYALGAGFLLVCAGLLSSLGHLGQPQRAWRAFSQWRSSWLSREGFAAMLTFVPALALALALFQTGWMPADTPAPVEFGSDFLARGLLPKAASILLLAGSLATIFCTANIYACLKPIRAWHNHHVVTGYLLLGLYSGGLISWVLATLPHARAFDPRYLLIGLVVLAAITGILKLAYWRFVDRGPTVTTGDATGLGALGSVGSFEQPHTEENYLTHEMGFRLARKHSRKLRNICLVSGFAIPALLALVALLLPRFGGVAAWLALFAGMGGIFIERWLFFAEAKHTVMLYYGARNG